MQPVVPPCRFRHVTASDIRPFLQLFSFIILQYFTKWEFRGRPLIQLHIVIILPKFQENEVEVASQYMFFLTKKQFWDPDLQSFSQSYLHYVGSESHDFNNIYWLPHWDNAHKIIDFLPFLSLSNKKGRGMKGKIHFLSLQLLWFISISLNLSYLFLVFNFSLHFWWCIQVHLTAQSHQKCHFIVKVFCFTTSVRLHEL